MICPRFQTVCSLDACREHGCVDIPIVTRAVPEVPANVYSVLGQTWAEARNLLALIERLAPVDPLYDDCICWFCDLGITGPNDEHAADCPWVEARNLLERAR